MKTSQVNHGPILFNQSFRQITWNLASPSKKWSVLFQKCKNCFPLGRKQRLDPNLFFECDVVLSDALFSFMLTYFSKAGWLHKREREKNRPTFPNESIQAHTIAMEAGLWSHAILLSGIVLSTTALNFRYLSFLHFSNVLSNPLRHTKLWSSMCNVCIFIHTYLAYLLLGYISAELHSSTLQKFAQSLFVPGTPLRTLYKYWSNNLTFEGDWVYL